MVPSGPSVTDDPNALPQALLGDGSAAGDAEPVSLTTVFEDRIERRYTSVIERGWYHFGKGEYQRALACFRTVEAMARARSDGRSVQLGILLSYVAGAAYSAAGKQMAALLAREGSGGVDSEQSGPWLFDPVRRDVLQRYDSVTAFQAQRAALGQFANRDNADPLAKMTLCYCLWLEGYSRDALETAKSFTGEVPSAQRRVFTRFLMQMESSRAAGLQASAGP